MRTTILFLSMASLTIAQETAAPTPERAGPARGETWNGYNIVNSIETGYRFAAVGGDDVREEVAVGGVTTEIAFKFTDAGNGACVAEFVAGGAMATV